MGERIPCPGTLWAKLDTGIMPDLTCDADPTHVTSPTVWERQGWKRRFNRPLDQGGLQRLGERLRA